MCKHCDNPIFQEIQQEELEKFMADDMQDLNQPATHFADAVNDALEVIKELMDINISKPLTVADTLREMSYAISRISDLQKVVKAHYSTGKLFDGLIHDAALERFENEYH